VELVLEYLAYDPDLNKLFEAFPRLTLEDVKAYLAYTHKLIENETPEPQHAPPLKFLLDENVNHRPVPNLNSSGYSDVTV
jgi:hypothetical protein